METRRGVITLFNENHALSEWIEKARDRIVWHA